jgi:hypothetical protein
MRSRCCSGPGRLSGDAKASGRRVTSKAPIRPPWKEGQAGPRRRPRPFSRILTAWKGYSRKLNFRFTEFSEVRLKTNSQKFWAPYRDIRRTGLPWCRDPGQGKVG